jgi:hypothetical protein
LVKADYRLMPTGQMLAVQLDSAEKIVVLPISLHMVAVVVWAEMLALVEPGALLLELTAVQVVANAEVLVLFRPHIRVQALTVKEIQEAPIAYQQKAVVVAVLDQQVLLETTLHTVVKAAKD